MLDSEGDAGVSEAIQKVAIDASKRRNDIRKEIKARGTLNDIAVKFSEPSFYSKLLFPFVGKPLPSRFDIDKEHKWSYMGRERFTELLNEVEEPWLSNRSALWVYGTRGYGKSHILAALVYYLSDTEKRIVYIPDCRACVPNAIPYLQAAMLFAWADDENKKEEIMRLKTWEKIYDFFQNSESFGNSRELIFVIDQMNALAESDEDSHIQKTKKANLCDWLERFRAGHKAILSTSANDKTYLQRSQRQTTETTIRVYGGFTPVSSNNIAEAGLSNCESEGNEVLVGTEQRLKNQEGRNKKSPGGNQN
jgi:Cdc6-like AAA superfamily ATPase